MMFCAARVLGLLLYLSAAAPAGKAPSADTPDWPHFRGPNCDGICTETGLLPQWPKAGPKLLWKMEGLGRGYSSTSIVGNKLLTMGDRKTGGSEAQMVIAFDLAARKELWSTRVGPPHKDGPRCTPTIDGELAYVIGTEGDLVCVETATGKVRWRKSFPKDFGGEMMTSWKFSESPLVDGDKLVCTPGGKQAMMVALNKKTGELIWKCAMPRIGDNGKDGAAYSSMVVAEVGGIRQYVQLVGRGVIGVQADTGKFLWGYNRVANKTANITTPVVHGDYVFATTSYKTGSALLKLTRAGDGVKAQEVYWLDAGRFANHHGGVVLVGDYIYGGDGQNDGAPVCIQFKTGKILWKEKPVGGKSAAVLYADGRLYLRYESGLMVLVEATPKALRVAGSFQLPVKSGPSWPHPVIHDKKLYVRDNDVLLCYDVAKRPGATAR